MNKKKKIGTGIYTSESIYTPEYIDVALKKADEAFARQDYGYAVGTLEGLLEGLKIWLKTEGVK